MEIMGEEMESSYTGRDERRAWRGEEEEDEEEGKSTARKGSKSRSEEEFWYGRYHEEGYHGEGEEEREDEEELARRRRKELIRRRKRKVEEDNESEDMERELGQVFEGLGSSDDELSQGSEEEVEDEECSTDEILSRDSLPQGDHEGKMKMTLTNMEPCLSSSYEDLLDFSLTESSEEDDDEDIAKRESSTVRFSTGEMPGDDDSSPEDLDDESADSDDPFHFNTSKLKQPVNLDKPLERVPPELLYLAGFVGYRGDENDIRKWKKRNHIEDILFFMTFGEERVKKIIKNSKRH